MSIAVLLPIFLFSIVQPRAKDPKAEQVLARMRQEYSGIRSMTLMVSETYWSTKKSVPSTKKEKVYLKKPNLMLVLRDGKPEILADGKSLFVKMGFGYVKTPAEVPADLKTYSPVSVFFVNDPL